MNPNCTKGLDTNIATKQAQTQFFLNTFQGLTFLALTVTTQSRCSSTF